MSRTILAARVAGLVAPTITAAPVLTWTIGSGTSPAITPGTYTGSPGTATYTLLRDGVPVSGVEDVSLATVHAYVASALDVTAVGMTVEETVTNGAGDDSAMSNTVAWAGAIDEEVTSYVEGWLPEDATATEWPGTTGTHDLTVLSGVPVPDADHFGAQDRPRVTLTADYYVSTEAGLADLLTAALGAAAPFSILWIWQADTTTASRALGGWGSSAGGTGGSYVDVWTRATGYSFRWHNDANANVDIEPITGATTDTRERALLISYAGAGGALRIDRWTEDGWVTAISSTPTNTGAFTTIDRFIIGGRMAGSGTPSVPINPNNLAECHVFDAALSAMDIAYCQAWVSRRYRDLSTHILTTRTQIINSATATFGTVGDPGGDGSNIMFPAIVKAAAWHVSPRAAYYCLFGHHDGTYIRLAYAATVDGAWTVLAAGTDCTLAALNAAGSYTAGTHISSPSIIVDDVGERYLMTVHADSTGLGHESVVAESIDLENWTFLGSAGKLNVSTTSLIYIRPFEYGGAWYAVSDTLDVYRSTDPWTPGTWARQATNTNFRASNGGNGRHAGCIVRGSTLVVFWTERSQYVERVMYASVALGGSWEDWATSAKQTLIWPYTDADGADLPWTESGAGVATARTRGLRDPQIFDDDGTIWLVYAQAGEDSIGVIDITAWIDPAFPE